ncbi:MAG: autotransporter domain-containing protein [Candidatus Avelusimicrobium sp.]|uniref:autotransporter outer membrane beta-barrel domain-containing protein n=1 Tax=Candidatus Avelusimicrobium sp. TaxID=3048833 RepID=UPI003EFD45C8
MNKFLSGFFAVLFAVSAAGAEVLNPIEKTGDVSDQTLVINPSTTGTEDTMIAGGASLQGSATNNTVTVNANVTDTNDGKQPDGIHNHYIVGGAVYKNTADGNTVNISQGVTVKGRAVAGGLARTTRPENTDSEKWETGSATNNTVNINGATITVAPQDADTVFSISDPVAVAGGASQYFSGNVSGNTVNISNNSTINGIVAGGLSYVETTQEEVDDHDITPVRDNNNNTVNIKDSTVNGDVYGSFGGVSGNYNTVRLDNTTVNGNVIAAESGFSLHDGSASVGTFNYNRVELLNGTKVGSAAAVDANNNNASYNSMLIQNSAVQDGEIYTVKMVHGLEDNSNTISGATNYNSLTLKDLTGTTVNEIGAALNMTGNPTGNSVSVLNSNVTVAFDANKTFGGIANVTNLTSQGLLGTKSVNGYEIAPALNTANGYILGGATADYTSQVNSSPSEEEPEEVIKGFGSSSNNNTINLQGGEVTANVVGGFASYVREVKYCTVQTDDQGRKTEEKTVVKNGRITTTTTITYTYAEDGSSTSETTTESSDPAELIDEKFSASNNTIVLTDVTLNGNVYGGYVDGAELKQENMLTQNNTVVMAGKAQVTGTVYGGSNTYSADTNRLVFRRNADGENFVKYNPTQFKNFNTLWNIEGNFETRLEFTQGDVHAVLMLDQAAMKEQGATTILKTGGLLEGYQPVVCNGSDNCIKYSSDITLATDKLGIYTFALTPEIAGEDVVNWNLSSTKETTNLEVYGQLPLVGLALAMEGQEMLGAAITDAWKNDNESNTFLNGAYHHTRYKTGSGFDLDSGIVQAGAWKKFTSDWLGGFFVKYAHGSYETFPIDVDGDADVYAGGLLTSLRYSETGRLEVDAEIGYMDMEFNSSELSSTFKSNGMYYGFGAGFVETLMEDLDLFANFRYLHKGKDDITDNLGQKVEFDTMQSMALRFGAEYTFNQLDLYGLKPALGAMGIYEMDGKSTVRAEGIQSDEASMKGMSGRAQLSLVYNNKDMFLPLRTALTVYGMAGKREGVGGEVNITFSF